MFQVASDWNPKQGRLKKIIQKADHFEEMISLLSDMHSKLHSSCVYGVQTQTYMDEICMGLDPNTFSTMPTGKDVTVAWNLWHITRIEDLTANLLVAKSKQVLNADWLKRLNTGVKDTANAMSDEEIIRFSEEVSMSELVNYRNAVGERTKEVIQSLKPEDMKRRVEKEHLAKILDEGGVIQHKESIWLLDFWGRKTVAGIFLMPITRHQVGHLNDCSKLKEKCRKLFSQ